MSDYKLFYVDDCMYVAALTEDDARKHVQDECGEDCASQIDEIAASMVVETANIEDGEEATADSSRTAQQLIEEHLHFGGTLPWTVAYDNY